MEQFSRDNHYIPQFYLKQWANNEKKVWVYRLLVSHENIPLWQRMSYKDSIGWQRDLYTGLIKDAETDEVEHWFDKEIENPARRVFEKINNDERLNKIDKTILIRFMAAQFVRTPASYFRSKDVFENVVNKATKMDLNGLTQKSTDYILRPTYANEFGEFSKWFPIKVEVKEPFADEEKIKIELTTGFIRNTWHFINYTLLNRTYNCLLEHNWHVINVPAGVRLYTSDDPVMFVNFCDKGEYDFKGGWGRKLGNIFYPLTPKHFLFTEIGSDINDEYIRNNIYSLTYWMQRLTIENAFRSIYSISEVNNLPSCRKRIVSETEFNKEKEFWKNWDLIQRNFADELK